ncbi:hypothetical protein [Butyrivibrio sp.]|uniref:hypothetical protein n=1 Tax=Butyrivibrio sp. TaxID=28121 RepID=UPI0025C0B946|nr:hypothetical protein [Butyrivibrio sp.]MBQ7428352.1 hypothetical protein [Butyrivibrio sp.]MBQ9303656.1 hypothetical protein [Butyrivibrio sp.]
MGRFAVKVKQILSETVIVDDPDVTTQEQANELAKRYDEEVGVDTQEIEDVTFEAAEIPDDPYALVISSKDLED